MCLSFSAMFVTMLKIPASRWRGGICCVIAPRSTSEGPELAVTSMVARCHVIHTFPCRLFPLKQLYIQPMMGAGLNYECYRFGISPSANALVLGATVMEGFYVVFDRARKRVGFAASPCAGE